MLQTDEPKYIKLTYVNRDYQRKYAATCTEMYLTKYFKVIRTNRAGTEFVLIQVLHDFSYLVSLEEKTKQIMIKAAETNEFYMTKNNWESNNFNCYDYIKFHKIEETKEDAVLLHDIG